MEGNSLSHWLTGLFRKMSEMLLAISIPLRGLGVCIRSVIMEEAPRALKLSTEAWAATQ